MTRRDVEQAARTAGPWTDAAAARARALREAGELSDAERDELRVLRQREISEAARIRREVRG